MAELNREAARLARAVADEYTARTPGKPRFVAGVLGPTSRTLSISPDVNDPGYRNVTWDELVRTYYEATDGLVKGGADLILIETIFDTLSAKAAVFAVKQYFDEGVKSGAQPLPIMISGTITDASGRTLSGQTVEAFWNSLRHAEPFSFGFNCALGARDLRQHVAEIAVLCHHDLHHLNILDDGARLWLVDWEYAGRGDPLLDVAGFLAMHDLGPEPTQAFVAAYGRLGPDDFASLDDARWAFDYVQWLWYRTRFPRRSGPEGRHSERLARRLLHCNN